MNKRNWAAASGFLAVLVIGAWRTPALADEPVLQPKNAIGEVTLNVTPADTSAVAPAPPAGIAGGSGSESPHPNAPPSETAGDPGRGPTGGDPVRIMSGDVVVQETDIVIPCPLLDLVFIRTYDSNLTYDHPLGHRWTHSYNWSVKEFAADGWVLLKALSDPWLPPYQGAFWWFKRQSDGSYKLAGNAKYQLVKTMDGYTVGMPGGIDYLFDGNGVLQSISHAAGQNVTLTYAGIYPYQRLMRVEHDNGQYLNFSYSNMLMTAVSTASTNLSLSFSYNGRDELKRVIRHTVRGDFDLKYDYNSYYYICTAE